MGGHLCLDGKKHPKPVGFSTTSLYVLLNQDYSGCGVVTGGTDNAMSKLAGETKVQAFFTDNKNVLSEVNLGSDFFNLYTTMPNGKMYLYGRNKIMIDCDTSCNVYRDFKFAESSVGLINAINNLWDKVKKLSYVGGILSAVGLALLIYVIFMRNRATQGNYFWVYAFIMTVTFIILI